MAPGKLQEELNRSEPFASLQQEALVSLLRTGDQLQNRLTRFFREHDLTISQFNLLWILKCEGRPMTCGEVSERLVHVVPALTGVVDRLEQQGLVLRERCTEDRRVVYISITEAGDKLAQQAYDPLLDLEQELLHQLTTQELTQLITLLEKTRDSMHTGPPE